MLPTIVIHKEKIIELTAKKLSEGKSFGWFQGKMEFGPRALGNDQYWLTQDLN